jgi:starch synthase
MAFLKKQKLKVLFVGTEAAPFVKAGGLGGVLYALPRALTRLGYDARVFIPRYASVDSEKFKLTMELEGLTVPTGNGAEGEASPATLTCNVKRYTPEKNGRSPVITYFLENLEYYEKRSNIYGYNDDAVRWALLSRGVLEFLRGKKDGWMPDVIIANDWQTGLLCNYLRTDYKYDELLSPIATVFMIHNLSYQGMFDQHFVSELDYDDGQSGIPSFFDHRLLKLNGMRRGIIYADVISTVSANYAKEIMTKEYGELLDGLLRERRSRVYGILNGIDYEEFDPSEDAFLVENYDERSLERRAKNKAELQSRFGLDESEDTFLLAIASRLSGQKGFDLLFPIMDILLRELDIQLAVLGSGEGSYMSFFQELEQKYPRRVGTNLTFDPVLPHVIHGGTDAILIPSRFEPAGLLQLEAMRYGAVPIVRKTGGLADTVTDFSSMTGKGTGFVFKEFDPYALMIAVTRAYEAFRNKRVWVEIQRQAMAEDFSWDHSAKEHTHLFSQAVEFRRRDISAKE